MYEVFVKLWLQAQQIFGSSLGGTEITDASERDALEFSIVFICAQIVLHGHTIIVIIDYWNCYFYWISYHQNLM